MVCFVPVDLLSYDRVMIRAQTKVSFCNRWSIYYVIGGGPRGAKDSPSRSNFFHFNEVLAKILSSIFFDLFLFMDFSGYNYKKKKKNP